jgi:hypothetical protein
MCSIPFNSVQFNSIEQAAINKSGDGWRLVYQVYLWLAGLIDYYARAAIIIVGCGWTCTLFFLLHRHHGPRLRRGSLRSEQRGPGIIYFIVIIITRLRQCSDPESDRGGVSWGRKMNR